MKIRLKASNEIFEFTKEGDNYFCDTGFLKVPLESLKESEYEILDSENEELFNFSKALELLKKGECLTRKNWNGKNQYIVIGKFVSFINYYTNKYESDNKDTIVFYGTSGIQVGWLASQGDLLAEDWMVYNEE